MQRHDVFRSVAAVGDAEFDASTRRFRLRLSADLRPFLFGLHGDFSRAHTASVFKLRTPYAILFYLHLRRYVGYTKKREHTVTVQDLLTALQVPSKSEYTRDWWRFESDILRPALREVQEKTELRATYTVERSGRTDRTHGPVTGIVFRVREDAAALAAQRKPLVSPPAPPPPSENEQGGREGSDPGRAR